MVWPLRTGIMFSLASSHKSALSVTRSPSQFEVESTRVARFIIYVFLARFSEIKRVPIIY